MDNLDLIKMMDKLRLYRETEITNNPILKDTVKVNDVIYIGTINWKDTDTYGMEYESTKDIMMLIEDTDGTLLYKFYDENNNLLAVDRGDGILLPELEFTNTDNLSFLSDISNLDKNGISLEQTREELLEEYAKILGIDNKDISSIGIADLEQKLDSKNEKDKDKITLDKDKDSQDEEFFQEQNENTLKSISTKSEVDLSKRVTDTMTLGDLLGISSGGKLISIYSENIENNQNSTEFSFIIQKPDGSLESADMLSQFGGVRPDENILASNRDGSHLQAEQVNSMYSIDSTANTHDMLAIKRGSMGILELSYVQMDKTDYNQGMSIPIETDHMYPVTHEVQYEMDLHRGDDNITNKLDEFEEHQKAGCNDITLEEADGKDNTGHEHIENNQEMLDSYIDKIMENDTVDYNYSKDEVKEQFIKIAKENPDWDLEKVQEYVETDLERAAPIQERY